MGTYVAGPSPMGGVLWKRIDCACDGLDDVYNLVKRFIKEHAHPEWSLSIFNLYTKQTMEIKCDLSEMPMIAECVYRFEHAHPVLFIGENPLSNSYVIGMCFQRWRIYTPIGWEIENGEVRLKYKQIMPMQNEQTSTIEDLLKTMMVRGVSVTQRSQQVKQPIGGYINRKELKVISLGAGADALNPKENVHTTLIGLGVDYLTRFMTGIPVEDAFRNSLRGAEIVGNIKTAEKLISGVKGLDNTSIINAIKLSGFAVCVRAGIAGYVSVQTITPDAATIENVRTMVNRSLNFFDKYGPKVLDGLTFEGGYTRTVTTGCGDFTTADTLWDFKAAKSSVKKNQTLQLLMYWRMGLHSIHPEFQSIKYLGVYNPRRNEVSRIAVADISSDVIDKVESEIIGYGKDK